MGRSSIYILLRHPIASKVGKKGGAMQGKHFLFRWILAGLLVAACCGVGAQPAWRLGGDGCQVTDNSAYNARLRELAMRLFKRYDANVGCVTSPWLEGNYGTAGLDNHAGIDFRVRGGGVDVPVSQMPDVYPAFAGRVVTQRLNTSTGSSTLVVESTENGRTFRTFYLHCSAHHRTVGNWADPDEPLCRAGAVGATAQHLHLEVKIAGSSDYDWDSSGLRALSGSHCSNDQCDRAEVAAKTIDPVELIGSDTAQASTSWTTGSYGNYADIGKTMSVPGAASIEVFITGSTERDYDFVTVYDAQGRQVGQPLHGSISERLVVAGDTVTVRLRSDGSVTDRGITVSVSKIESSGSAPPPPALTEALKSDLLMDCLERGFAHLFPGHQQTVLYPQSDGSVVRGRIYGSNNFMAVWRGDFWVYYGQSGWSHIGPVDDVKANYCPAIW